MESIGRPILLEYSGYDAESNLIDARLLGVSMYGLGRLYVSNYHFFLTGQIPAQLKNPDMRIAVGPPQIGSISYLVYMLLVHGRLAVYPELLWEMVDICVPQIIKAVKSCTVLAAQANGAKVTTIEGLSSGTDLHPLQAAFRETHGLQCGFCTPGMIMSAADLLAKNPNPSEPQIRSWLKGNICRCTGYHNIVKAVQTAAAQMGGQRVAAE